ncbi:hypothetical protein D3C73_1035960 [compost metagenome]
MLYHFRNSTCICYNYRLSCRLCLHNREWLVILNAGKYKNIPSPQYGWNIIAIPQKLNMVLQTKFFSLNQQFIPARAVPQQKAHPVATHLLQSCQRVQ